MTAPMKTSEVDWCFDMSAAPKDGTNLLLQAPDGRLGIGYMETRHAELFEGGIVTEQAAWIGRRPGDQTQGLMLGGFRAMDAVAWAVMPLPPGRAGL